MVLVKVDSPDETGVDGVWVLRLCISNQEGVFENTFTPLVVDEMNAALDRILQHDGPCGIVVTGPKEGGKFFCNGHDIGWLENAAKMYGTGPGSASREFLNSFYVLLSRFMTLPVITVAAINGHAFAGGCLVAMAQDYRIMRSDRGFLCMNEVDMQLMAAPDQETFIKPGAFPGADAKMTAVLRAKLTDAQVREMYVTGKRYNGNDALESGLVHGVAEGDLGAEQKAVQLCGKLAAKGVKRNRRTLAVLKTELVRNYLGTLRGESNL